MFRRKVVSRREKEIENMKQSILLAAKEVTNEEGFNKLSIRKIAKKLDYAPSLVYYYFKDKQEIQNALMQDGYQKIVQAVKEAEESLKTGIDKLQHMSKNYILTALSMKDEFLKAQLNTSSVALKHTSSMFEGALKSKPALSVLGKSIVEIRPDLSEAQVELKAQMITASTFGLIAKLIVEEVNEKQKKRLIDYFIEHVIENIVKG